MRNVIVHSHGVINRDDVSKFEKFSTNRFEIIEREEKLELMIIKSNFLFEIMDNIQLLFEKINELEKDNLKKGII